MSEEPLRQGVKIRRGLKLHTVLDSRCRIAQKRAETLPETISLDLTSFVPFTVTSRTVLLGVSLYQ